MAFDFPMSMPGMDMATSQAGSALGGLSIPGVQAPRMNMNPMQRLMGLRAMGYMHRLNSPGFGRSGYNSGRGMPGSMGPNDTTGVDPSTMDMGQVNSLLGQFGEQMPSNPSPYAILPNSGFFGRHQRLGGALEGALFGAANTAGADTWGEGISNVARGLIAGNAERGRAVNQQFQQPISTAMQMGQLMQLQQRMGLEQAQENRAQAQADKADKVPAVKSPWSMGHIGQDGKLYAVRNDDPEGKVQKVPGQEENASLLKPSTASQKLYGGISAPVAAHIAQLVDPRTGQPYDPSKLPPPEVVAHANQMIQHDALARAATAPAMSQEGADARQYYAQLQQDKVDSWKAYRIDPEKVKTSGLTKYAQQAQEWGLPSDPGDPKFIDSYNRHVDKMFGLGTFAPQGSTPMPRSKAPTSSPSSSKPTVITLPNGQKYTID